jgi:hypothetical protein
MEKAKHTKINIQKKDGAPKKKTSRKRWAKKHTSKFNLFLVVVFVLDND